MTQQNLKTVLGCYIFALDKFKAMADGIRLQGLHLAMLPPAFRILSLAQCSHSMCTGWLFLGPSQISFVTASPWLHCPRNNADCHAFQTILILR